MSLPAITRCPGTLAEGHNSYSRTCLKWLFNGKKVYHVLPYYSPATKLETDDLFIQSQKQLSISGVQEKFSVLLEKNRLRLIREGERGTYILKPIPGIGKRADQMPANEHLTMQIARQVYRLETAENALIFFQDGAAAYITKRFDYDDLGNKLAQEDFASLAGRTPQTHGEDYKYQGNYLELFEIMKATVPAYKIEAPKLLRLILFNYLFSNGDAHFKNFSLLETRMGDFRLSPAYDLLNSRMHIEDTDFALHDGLLSRNLKQGTISQQFRVLAECAGVQEITYEKLRRLLLGKSNDVEKLIANSYMDEKAKRNYWQAYLGRLKQMEK